MEITINDIGPSKKSIKVTIPVEEITKKYNDQLKQLSHSVFVPGFRAGKTPKRVLERKFGDAIFDDLKRDFISQSFDKAFKEHNLKPLSEPELDFDGIKLTKDQPCSFEINLEIQPIFDLPQHKGLEAEKQDFDITDENLDEMLENMRMQKGEMVPIESGKSEEKDNLVCEVALRIGEETISQEDNHMCSANHFHYDGLHIKDTLVGKEINEIYTEEVVLPEDFKEEEHQGKEAELSIKILEIKRFELPELNDEFAQEVDAENLEDLKNKVREQLEMQKESEINNQLEQELIHNLGHKAKIELPEQFLQKRIDESVKEKKRELAKTGQSEEEIAKAIEEDSDKTRHEVEDGLREFFLLEKIAEEEEIEVSRKEVDDYIDNLAKHQRQHWPHEMRKLFEEQGLLHEIEMRMKHQKVLTFLRENANIKEAEKSASKDKKEETVEDKDKDKAENKEEKKDNKGKKKGNKKQKKES